MSPVCTLLWTMIFAAAMQRGGDRMAACTCWLNQAEESELPIIEQRLQKHGISAQPVPFEQQLALVAAATQEGEQR